MAITPGRGMASASACPVHAAVGKLDPLVWDAFAVVAGAGIRGSARFLSTWRLRYGLSHRLLVLELFTLTGGAQRKIGQCAIGRPRRGGVNLFLDSLHLAPGQEQLWPAAMQAVFEALGPGDYEYGWNLSLDPRRDAAARQVDGVTLAWVKPLVVHAVDFSRWDTWEAYFRAISENSRRSYKAAARDLPTLRVDVRRGADALRDVVDVARLHDDMAERKGLSGGRSALRYAFGVVSGGTDYVTAVARVGKRALSAYYGAEFGSLTYYLEGGSARDNGGASWTLLISMLQRAYNRNPRGKFVMGYVDYSLHSDEAGGGLLRSRNACRVTSFETSIFRVHYDPAAPKDEVPAPEPEAEPVSDAPAAVERAPRQKYA